MHNPTTTDVLGHRLRGTDEGRHLVEDPLEAGELLDLVQPDVPLAGVRPQLQNTIPHGVNPLLKLVLLVSEARLLVDARHGLVGYRGQRVPVHLGPPCPVFAPARNPRRLATPSISPPPAGKDEKPANFEEGFYAGNGPQFAMVEVVVAVHSLTMIRMVDLQVMHEAGQRH